MRSSVLLMLLAVAACAGDSSPPTDSGSAPVPLFSAAEQRDLAALRAGTARFHRIAVAHAAGYDTQFPPGCFASDEGGMGLHYINAGLVGTLDPARPQLLLYEPQANGSLRLVGVEFLAEGAPTDTPPVLFGQSFRWHPVFEVWVLHVWTWQHNPAGLYADWNPRVTCAHAPVPARASHH